MAARNPADPAPAVWDHLTGESKEMAVACSADLVEVLGFPLLPLSAFPAVAADLIGMLAKVEEDRRRLYKKYAALRERLAEVVLAIDCGEPVDVASAGALLAEHGIEVLDENIYEKEVA